jgi:hypothetical protein
MLKLSTSSRVLMLQERTDRHAIVEGGKVNFEASVLDHYALWGVGRGRTWESPTVNVIVALKCGFYGNRTETLDVQCRQLLSAGSNIPHCDWDYSTLAGHVKFYLLHESN